MFRNLLLVSAAILSLISCESDNAVYSDVRSLKNSWDKNHKIAFEFKNQKKDRYDFFIVLRNDNSFEYSNIFLIAEMEFPDGKVIADTLEYEMATPEGKWLGKGLGSIKEHLLWYKENVPLDSIAEYKIYLSQAMRKTGSPEGIRELKGVLDVGLEVRQHLALNP